MTARLALALTALSAGLALMPHSAIAMIERANGMVMIEGEKRLAEAEGAVAVNENSVQKARRDHPRFRLNMLAGILAAKRTSDLIPLCHQLALTGVDVDTAIFRPATFIEQSLENLSLALLLPGTAMSATAASPRKPRTERTTRR